MNQTANNLFMMFSKRKIKGHPIPASLDIIISMFVFKWSHQKLNCDKRSENFEVFVNDDETGIAKSIFTNNHYYLMGIVFCCYCILLYLSHMQTLSWNCAPILEECSYPVYGTPNPVIEFFPHHRIMNEILEKCPEAFLICYPFICLMFRNKLPLFIIH